MTEHTWIPDTEAMTDLFLELTSMDSISYHEGRVATRLKEALISLGFEVTEDDAGQHYGSESGNLYGYLKGTADKEPVLFSSHMDTVEPGLGKHPRLTEGRITSDGSTVLGADDVCGITEILEGIRLAKENPEGYGDIEVLFTVAEEVYGKGAEVFDFSRIRSRQAFVLDMSGPVGYAARKAPSLVSFRAHITGQASHAGFAPEKGINAVQAAAKAIARISQGQLSEETTLNVGTIAGGTADNIVSESCTVTGEARSFVHEIALEEVHKVQEIFRQEADAIGAALEFTQEIPIVAYETAADAPVCQRFQDACRSLDLPGKLQFTHGGSDNNVFALRGISGIVLSCGMYRSHSTEEYTAIEDLETGARLVAAIISQP